MQGSPQSKPLDPIQTDVKAVYRIKDALYQIIHIMSHHK